MRTQELVGWVIDDNGRSRADAIGALRSIGIEAIGLAAETELDAALAAASISSHAPDLIVLDLRLPWADEATLVENALACGLACLQRLKTTEVTSNTPVIVFSAFVDDELVRSQLRPYAPAAIIDKTDEDRLERLPIVMDNVLPNRPVRTRETVRRIALTGEHQVLRAGALIGAITAIATIVALVVRWIW
jgi:CheY-like chemotaxis protein